MSAQEQVRSIVTSLQPVIDGVSEPAIVAPSPCPGWDVRSIANHLLGTVEAMRRVGAGEPLDPDDPWGILGEHLTENWQRDLSALLTAYADTWSRPEAWQGEAVGVAMPRQVIGEMGYVEVMLHGWDLAKGSGQEVDYGHGAVAAALEVMEHIGEQGRRQGAFGAEVSLPGDATPFDRVLAQAGRDPQWSAA